MVRVVEESDLPDVVRQMKQRLGHQKDRARVVRLWTAAYVLLGLKYDKPFVEELFQGVLGMKESTTYQAIIAEGRVEGAIQEARKMLLALGEDRFGVPASTSTVKTLEEIDSLPVLEQLARRLLKVDSWDELLPRSHKRSRRNSSSS